MIILFVHFQQRPSVESHLSFSHASPQRFGKIRGSFSTRKAGDPSRYMNEFAKSECSGQLTRVLWSVSFFARSAEPRGDSAREIWSGSLCSFCTCAIYAPREYQDSTLRGGCFVALECCVAANSKF